MIDMNFLNVIKSRGFVALIVLFVILDIIGFFAMEGFGSFVFAFVVEIAMAFYYVIARSLMDVDAPIWFLSDDE